MTVRLIVLVSSELNNVIQPIAMRDATLRIVLSLDYYNLLMFYQLLPFKRRGMIAHKKERHGDRVRKVYSLSPEGRTFCEQLFKRFSSIVSK